jgi:low temperature requirement protein LtrA
MTRADAKPFQRDRHGHAKVTNEELFFDLIYAFAITQLSHRLLEDLTPIGAVQRWCSGSRCGSAGNTPAG